GPRGAHPLGTVHRAHARPRCAAAPAAVVAQSGTLGRSAPRRGRRHALPARPRRSRRAGVASASGSARRARGAPRGAAARGGVGVLRGTHPLGDRPAHRSAAGYGENAPAHRSCEAGGGLEAPQGLAAMTDWLGMTPRPVATRAGMVTAALMPMDRSEPMWMALGIPAGVARVTGAAMSIEPRRGSPSPTGPMLFRLNL